MTAQPLHPAAPPDEPVAPASIPGRAHAFRALRHRAYRAYFVAQLVSFVGTWMQGVAQGWLVYRLTGSALALGTVAFAGQIPVLLLAPVAGVLADTLPLRRVVAVTQGLLLLQAVALAVLTFEGLVTVEVVIALAVLQGVISSFDLPARQTLLLELSGPEDLSSAIALSSTAVNAARIGGTALGGILVAALGEATCFAINAGTFLVMIVVVLAVRPAHERAAGLTEPPLTALRAGVRYALGAPHVRAILPVVALIALAGLPYITFLPIFAAEVLSGGPALLGWLNAAVGAGAIAGALLVASLPDRSRLAPRLAQGLLAFGLGLLTLGASTFAPLSLLALVVTGFGMLSCVSAANTLLQGDTPGPLRGRVMALYTTVLVGLYPVGSLACGAGAERFGVRPTVAATGAITCLGALWLARRLPALRAARVGQGTPATPG